MALYSGDKLDAATINGLMAPIGTIIGWAKNFTGVPSIPDGWVRCEGQVLSDSESIFDGQTMPDLNVTSRFLRGNSTSDTTEGAIHTHTGTTGGPSATSICASGAVSRASFTHTHSFTTDHADQIPPYYNVVFIIRIK